MRRPNPSAREVAVVRESKKIEQDFHFSTEDTAFRLGWDAAIKYLTEIGLINLKQD